VLALLRHTPPIAGEKSHYSQTLTHMANRLYYPLRGSL